jgi:nucleoside-diphosphate-sugar epimerase
MSTRILITGGAGFIGYHLAWELLTSEGAACELVLVDNLQRGKNDVKPAPLGCVKSRLADTSKLQRLTGWKPKMSPEEGLKRTYEWSLAHTL